MSENKDIGTIFDIQHFSVSDGPGIRTTVFFKGCPLRCAWCHNPESYTLHTQIMFHPVNCVGCGVCAAVCPQKCHIIDEAGHRFDRSNCINCGKCVEHCLYESLQLVGKKVSVCDIIEEVAEDEFFYETSGGGLTISGGEPMLQSDFAISLAQAAKERLFHVCMETSGFCDPDKLIEITPYIDLFLYDYKITGAEKHQQYTGVENVIILNNLKLLDSLGAKIILRCPMIPDVNIDEEHVAGIIDIAHRMQNLLEIHLEPYHNIGVSKREGLGMETSLGVLNPPGKEILQTMAGKIRQQTGIVTKVL